MDPLLVAGRFREQVDSFLRDLDPVAHADLGADGRFDLVEVTEDTHARLPDQIFISGTASGIAISASVTARTSATLTPGAVSSRIALPSEKAMTAMSVTNMLTGLVDVSGRVHLATIFDLPFAACCMATITRLAPLTRSIAPPMPGTILPGIIQLARCPCASTCRPPRTVTSTWPPRINPKDIALAKGLAPGRALIGGPPGPGGGGGGR